MFGFGKSKEVPPANISPEEQTSLEARLYEIDKRLQEITDLEESAPFGGSPEAVDAFDAKMDKVQPELSAEKTRLETERIGINQRLGRKN